MNARLLIVDDEEEIRDMLSRHFRFQDIHVQTARNGKEALETMEKDRVDVVISDIKMPEMDGIQLLRELRRQYPMVHTIMITGYVTQENILACMRHGADNCVFKPLDENLTELDASIRKAVESINNWQNKLRKLRSIKPVEGEMT